MNTEHELFEELHEQEENGLFGNEHRRQYEEQQEALRLSAVISSVCDIHKGTRCEKSFPSYTDGKCRECGGQAN